MMFRQRWLWIVCVCLVIVMASAACSSGSDSSADRSSTDDVSGSGSGSKGTGNESGEGNGQADPVSIRIAQSDHGLQYVNSSTNLNEDIYVQYLEELTHTDLSFELLSHQEFNQSLTLLFAGGDLPDMIHTNGINTSEVAPAINAGALTPLNDLIDQYGPNLKKFIPQEVWDSGQVSHDGNIYAIPQLRPVPNRLIYYVRKDWADSIGLELPTIEDPFTIDEFIDMLRAFRDNAGNGVIPDNVIPVTGRERLRYMHGFFGVHDVIPNDYRYVDGQLLPNFVRTEMKDALEIYRTLYQEGLLDNEIFIQDGNGWNNKIKSGQAGVWIHGAENGATWHQNVIAESGNPDADVVAIPAPIGPDGQGGSGVYSSVGGVKWVVPASSDKAADVVKLLDRFFDEDVHLFNVFGIEGVDHEVVNGEIVYNYPEGDQELANRSRMYNHWLQFTGIEEILNEHYVNGLPDGERTMHAIRISENEGRISDGLDMPTPDTMASRPELAWDGTFMEVAARIITGEDELDAFDEFVEQWYAQGGDQVISEATDWYNSQP